MEQTVTADQEAALRDRIVAAVQAELDRHASSVVAETDKLRADTLRERDDLHRLFGDQLAALTRKVDSMVSANAEIRREIERAVERQLAERVSSSALAETESRLNRRIDQTAANLETSVSDAVRPHVEEIHDEQRTLAQRVEVLDGDLRRFDEQAARLVVHVNELTSKLQQRADDAAAEHKQDVDRRMDGIDERVEEIAESSSHQHVETAKLVRERSDRLEERLTVKVSTLEGSLREEVGSRIAEIDAHVGRVSQGLDDTLSVLGDRMGSVEQLVHGLEAQVQELRDQAGGVDDDTIEELKEKVSSAAGEAMLVRIDMERLEKATGERVESVNARLVTVESQLADTTMDVSTAVQLERLEELERAVMDLDPSGYPGSTASAIGNRSNAGDDDAGDDPGGGDGIADADASTIDPGSTEGLDLTALRLSE
ncbi:MAG: hypothetical protein WD225_04345 [Ilumatobacteraceae bacterium]